MNCFFNLPDLTFWSTSVRWWIHDDRIVVISTADLTFYKFHTVIYQPADRRFRKPRCSCVFFGPGNHTLGSVYVCNLCTGSGSGHNLGMSQYGAKAMAELGYTYDEILKFYYTDITIK